MIDIVWKYVKELFETGLEFLGEPIRIACVHMQARDQQRELDYKHVIEREKGQHKSENILTPTVGDRYNMLCYHVLTIFTNLLVQIMMGKQETVLWK